MKNLYLCLIAYLLINPVVSLSQTSWKGTSSTSWANAANWTAGIPTATIDAIIGDANFTGVNQPTISSTANCKSLTIGGTKASVLTIGSTTTASGSIQVNANGSIVHNSSSLTVKGNWINNGSYTTNGTGCNVIFAGVTQFLQGSVITTFRKLTINAGSVTTLNTNVTVSGSGSKTTVKGTLDPGESPTYKLTGTAFTVNASAILKVRAALFTDNYNNSGTVTFNSNSVVDYASTTVNQTISSSFTYSTLTISGSGTKSLAANLPSLRSSVSSNGNINVNAGTFDLGGFTANRGTSVAGGNFTVAGGATLKIGGTNSFPSNYTANTLNLTSTVEYNGTNQTVAAKTYGYLKFSSSSGAAIKTMPASPILIKGDFTSVVGNGTSVSFTAAANISVSGQVTIGASTTFNGGSFTHDVAGNWTNNGTFTGSTSTISLTGGGDIISGSGAQNFYNLTIAANNITAISNLTLSGDLSTTSPGSFTMMNGNTLTMTGTSKAITGTGITLDNLTVSGAVSSASSLAITGNVSVTGSFTGSSGGNVIMAGTSKTLGGGGTIVFSSLQITGTITASSNFSITQSLDVSGSFSATAGTATFTGSSTLNGTANLFNVTINGTSLALSANSVLGIAGALSISAGTLNVTSNKPNTVTFNGSGVQSVNAITYHHLTLANGNTKTAAAGITVNGNLTIDASTTFSAGSFTHTLLGNWINNGTFSAGTSTVQMTGASNTTITGSTTFNVLTINKSASSNSVTLQSNVSVPTINMTTGSLFTGTNTLTITATRTGNGIILGTITRTHTFSILTDYAFEGPDNTINFTTVSGVTSITVYVATGSISDFPNAASINRVYNISVSGGSYNARLRLHYEDGELNGNSESAMQLIRYNGSAWTSMGKIGNNATSNYVEQTLLTNITNRWTCASNTSVISWNGSVSTDWNTAANWSVVSGTPASPPSVNDIVQIGTTTFNNQPTISTAVSVKSIVMGSAKAATLTIGSGGSLTTTGNISGTWSANATHTINAGNQMLTIGGDLIMSDGSSGHAINLSAGSATISINGGWIQAGAAGVNFTGAAVVSVKGDYSYSSGSFAAGTSTVSYSGTGSQQVASVTYNNLTINKTSGIALVNAPLTATGNCLITAGVLDVNANATISGAVTISSGATINGDGATITLGGNWSNSGTFIPGTGSVNFNGTNAQTVTATTFNDLIINKSSGTASLTGNVIINGNMSVSAGTFDLASFIANRSAAGGQLTLANGATLIAGGGNNFPQYFATHSLGNSSTVHYNGSAAQSVAGIAYGNIIFSNGGAVAKTLAGSTTVNGSITINSGATFNASSYTINLWSNWSNGGTFIPSTSTLVLNGSGKTINGTTTFNRVTVNGSYSVIGNSDITYNGLLFVTPTGSYAAGGGTAIVNGDLTNSGSLSSSGTTTFSGTVVQTIRLINALVSTSTGVVNFNGTVPPVMNSTSKPTFANLNINNTGGVNPSKDWLILGNMTIANGASFNGGVSSHTIVGNFTNNGTLTSDGTINFTPITTVTIKVAGTSFTSTGTVNFGGSGLITIAGAPTVLTDVRISNTNTAGVTPASGWTMNGDLVINSDARFNAVNFSYSVVGDIESNGVLDGGTSTFTMSSPAGQLTGSPYTKFNHFVVSGAISTNSDYYVAGNFTNNGSYDGSLGTLIMNGNSGATINGSTSPNTISQLTIEKTGGAVVSLGVNVSEVFMLLINSGTLFTSTYAITQDAGGGLLMISDGATLKLGGTNSLPGFSAYGLDLASTVEYAGTNQIIGNAASYGNLTISSAGTKTGFVPLIIQNNFTQTAGTFSSATSVTHTIGGNWTVTGGSFSNASSTILLNGTGNQDVNSAVAFNNLTVNKPSGIVALSSNATVNAILNLTAGKISLGNNNLTLGNSGSIINATANNYIIAVGNGTLNQQVLAGGSKVFPVGLNTAYTPATVGLTAGSASDIMNVRMLAAPYHGGLSGDVASNYAVNATWVIGENISGGSNATITLQWPASLELPGFNRTLSRLAHFTSGAWEFGNSDIAAAGTNPYTVTRNGFTDFSPFAVSTYMALPVTWVNVTARNENNNNVINWTVASELNNDYFEIEMSTNGNSFSAIGSVKGAGSTDMEQRYGFVHHDVTAAVYYYRIKQVDIDGKYSYSKIVRVNADKTLGERVSIINNPVHDKLSISIFAERSFAGSMTIADAAGKIVFRQKVQVGKGSNVVDIGNFNYANGIYYLVFVHDNGKKETVRFFRK